MQVTDYRSQILDFRIMKTVKRISFAELKESYIEVPNFLEKESGESVINKN